MTTITSTSVPMRFVPTIGVILLAAAAILSACDRFVVPPDPEGGLPGKVGKECPDGDCSECWACEGDQCPPVGLEPQLVVSRAAGSDEGDGVCVPLKTISAALDRAQSGHRVWVAPGEYGAGEAFPLTVRPGVELLGAIEPSAPKPRVSGTGAIPSGDGRAAVYLEPGGSGQLARLQGFIVDNDAQGPEEWDVIAEEAYADVQDNELEGHAGVWAVSPGDFAIFGNVLRVQEAGVMITGGGVAAVFDNELEGARVPVQLMAKGNGISVHDNTMNAFAGDGIVVGEGSPAIEENDLYGTGDGAGVRCQGACATPRLRRNHFELASGPCIANEAPNGRPDLGTASDPGGNEFQVGAGKPVLFQGSRAEVVAMGNPSWDGQPQPSCGVHIIFAKSAGELGVVEWGGGSQEFCAP